MSFDLTNKNISDTFQNLLQRTGSDNRLYDLTGNQVTNLRINGTLTADQYVVSSSVTNVITIAQSGSTIFGNSIDDTHQFTGNITASNNISASGTIIGGGLNINGTTTFNEGNITNVGQVNVDQIADDATGGDTAINLAGTTLDIAVASNSVLEMTSTKADFNVPIKTTSDITASNNISASGTIFANSGSFNYVTASIIDVNSDTIRLGGETFKKSDVQKLKQGKTLKDAGVGRAHGDLIAHDGTFDGNITASGVVSASGGFIGDGSGLTGLTSAAISSYTNNGNNRVVTSVNSTTVNSEANLTFDGTSLNVNGELTSSKVLVNAPNPTDDFFLLKSGSLDSLKVNNQGVLVLGGFTYTPTAVRGGLYYDQDDDEFYAGKNN